MKIEVLASVMNQNDYDIINQMNIRTNAIIINQCNKFDYEEIKNDKQIVRFFLLHERGVGLSRNNALMRANSDIVVFADEDEIFVDEYERIISNEFLKHPKADMIIFNVPSLNLKRPTATITRNKRLHKYNCMKFGAVNIAVKLKTIRKYNINFTLLFGGGAKYLSGEDSMFIIDFIKAGGIVYASNQVIAHVKQEESTWFSGFNDKYFISKGAFFYSISPHFWLFYCLQFLIRHNSTYNKIGFLNALSLMKKGVRELK